MAGALSTNQRQSVCRMAAAVDSLARRNGIMIIDPVVITGQGAAVGTNVTFSRPYLPYPQPVLSWADRIGSDHQMRPGLSGGHLVGGNLVHQDFGVPQNAGLIEIKVPFITKDMKNAIWTIYQAGGECHVPTGRRDDLECPYRVPQIEPRTSTVSQRHTPYSVTLTSAYSQRYK